MEFLVFDTYSARYPGRLVRTGKPMLGPRCLLIQMLHYIARGGELHSATVHKMSPARDARKLPSLDQHQCRVTCLTAVVV